MKKLVYAMSLIAITMLAGCSTNTSQSTPTDNTETSKASENTKAIQTSKITENTGNTEYYTFELSDQVTRTHVRFDNRYGISLAGDLYYSKDLDETATHPALIIGGPYGSVKEQASGVYANQMAQRGFVVLTFDPSFNGESGGEPRNVSSPDFFVEDFSAGVDYLGTLDYVDRENIGAIGICGSGGFAITAAQVDKRIKAIATASMYDISRYIRDGLGNTMTDEQRDQTLEQLGEQRWTDFENGGATVGASQSNGPATEVPEGLPPVAEEFFEYYQMVRGYHPNSPNSTVGFTQTSALPFMNFPLMNYINTISPRPILFIAGENAHSLYFSEDAYEAAAEPKELYVVPGANHCDLYDKVDIIPFDKLESFFNENL